MFPKSLSVIWNASGLRPQSHFSWMWPQAFFLVFWQASSFRPSVFRLSKAFFSKLSFHLDHLTRHCGWMQNWLIADLTQTDFEFLTNASMRGIVKWHVVCFMLSPIPIKSLTEFCSQELWVMMTFHVFGQVVIIFASRSHPILRSQCPKLNCPSCASVVIHALQQTCSLTD
jgi:hypothetical protein